MYSVISKCLFSRGLPFADPQEIARILQARGHDVTPAMVAIVKSALLAILEETENFATFGNTDIPLGDTDKPL